MKSELLKPLDNGFNYNSIKEIESLCSDLIMNAPPSDSPFIFIIGRLCFDICELIDSFDGSLSLHNKTEELVKPALIEMITSLDDGIVNNKLSRAHYLISTLRHVKTEIHSLT